MLLSEPVIEVFADEGVVGKMGIRAGDAVDLFYLTWGEVFVGIEAPAAGEQALAPQDLVDPGDAPAKPWRA
jgi:hypothetical protein